MFKGGDKRTSSSFSEFNQYVEDHDVFNSYLVRRLNDPSLVKVSYVITRYEYRPDLIARDIYGSTDYTGMLMSQCRMGVAAYRRGMIIRVLSKSDLDRIINELR